MERISALRWVGASGQRHEGAGARLPAPEVALLTSSNPAVLVAAVTALQQCHPPACLPAWPPKQGGRAETDPQGRVAGLGERPGVQRRQHGDCDGR